MLGEASDKCAQLTLTKQMYSLGAIFMWVHPVSVPATCMYNELLGVVDLRHNEAIPANYLL